MRRTIGLALAIIAVAAFVFFVPAVPHSNPSNCVFCPAYYRVDYTAVTWVLFGVGAYHTVWGTFGLTP